MKFQCEITNGDLNPPMFLSEMAGKSKNGGELLAKKYRTREVPARFDYQRVGNSNVVPFVTLDLHGRGRMIQLSKCMRV